MRDSGGFSILFAALAAVALLTGCGKANPPSQAERPPTADINIVIVVEFFDPDEAPEVDDAPVESEPAAGEPGPSDLGTPISEIPDMPAEDGAPPATETVVAGETAATRTRPATVEARNLGEKNRVFFKFGSAAVRGEQQALIHEWVDWLNDHPGWALRVEGHTDRQGPCPYNRWLGQQRANAARDLLLEHGVDPSRLLAVSFGEERPIVPGASRAEREQNRRVRAVPMGLDKIESYDPGLQPCASTTMARPHSRAGAAST